MMSSGSMAAYAAAAEQPDREDPEPREGPILFSGPMVRGILDGTKKQTRRVVTDQNSIGNVKPSRCDLTRAWADPGPSPAGNVGPYLHAPVVRPEDTGIVERIYPRYAVGDGLWVRETWHQIPGNTRAICYRASCENGAEKNYKFKPSIHMPRWASRISLELTGVRVERVQDISEGDAAAEGVPDSRPIAIAHPLKASRNLGWGTTPCTHREAYQHLWDSLNAKRGYGWDVNPWVWVLSFRRVTP